MSDVLSSEKNIDRPLFRVVRQSGLYALGNLAVKGSGLLLAPLFLNPAYLPVDDYGYFALLSVSAQIGIFIIGLGLGQGLLKYMSIPEQERDRRALPFTALVSTVALAIIAVIVLWIAAGPLADMLLDSRSRVGLIRLLAVYIALKVIGSIPLTIIRVQEKAQWYSVAIAGEMVFLVASAYYFLVVSGEGLYGIILALVVSASIGALVLTAAMLRDVSWSLRLRLVPSLVRYGTPLVLAGLAGWFLNAGDRYILKWLSTADVIAVYEWSSRIAGALNLLFVQSFQLAFSVIGLKSIGAGSTDLYRKTFRHYVVWIGWGVVGLSLLAYDGTLLLVNVFDADPAYLGVELLVFPIALGFSSYGLYIIVNNVLYAVGRTRTIGFNVLGAAVLNAVLNILLIPHLGGMGAAIATFVAFTFLALASTFLAEREIYVGYPWGLVLAVLGLCLLLFFIGHRTLEWSFAPRLLTRVVLIAIYPLAIWFTGVYGPKDLTTGWKALRSKERPRG